MRYLLELETNGPFEMWDGLIWINSLASEKRSVLVTPLMRCHEVFADLRPPPWTDGLIFLTDALFDSDQRSHFQQAYRTNASYEART